MKKDLMSLEMMEIQPLDDEALTGITGGCSPNLMGSTCSRSGCSVAFGDVCPESNAFGEGAHNAGQGRGTN